VVLKFFVIFKSRECGYRVGYGCTLKLETLIWDLRMLSYEISRQSLGTNRNVEYKILKCSAYYEISKLTLDQSD